jgi:capsular polysaccharide transport system permease protein
MTSLATAAFVLARVVGALLLRETRTRFGVNRLGYLWALAEPTLHVAIFIVIFRALDRASPIGTDTALFLATGVIPWLLFNHITDRTMKAIEANRALLAYPQVTPVDLVLSRMLLETATLLLVLILFGLTSFLTHGPYVIDNPLTVLGAFLCLAAFATGLGLLGGAIAGVLPSFAPAFAMIRRPLYFVSGVFFLADRLPPFAREWLSFNPILHYVEWLRSAFFDDFESRFADPPFAIATALSALCLGLAAERLVRPTVKLA